MVTIVSLIPKAAILMRMTIARDHATTIASIADRIREAHPCAIVRKVLSEHTIFCRQMLMSGQRLQKTS